MIGSIADARRGQASLQGRDADAGSPARYSVRAAERTLDILDALANAPGGISLARLSEAVGMPKSSLFRYVAVLEARRYVTRDPKTGTYGLGLALFSFDLPLRALAASARPWLERLRDQFGETINLAVLDGTRVQYLEVVESPKVMRLSARPGDHDFIHASALGKAISARLDDEAIRRILDIEGLPKLTSRTIIDAEEFMTTLAGVRKQGYAVDFGEAEEGACCVAVSLPLDRLAVPTGISLSSPATRFPQRRELPDVVPKLHETARQIAVTFRPERSEPT